MVDYYSTVQDADSNNNNANLTLNDESTDSVMNDEGNLPSYAESQRTGTYPPRNENNDVPPLALNWHDNRRNATTSPINNSSPIKSVKQQKYRGLVNQAMTCYLNSLLQTLYMTPEFRNTLYTYKDDSETTTPQTPEQLQELRAKNIPLQLQRLFVRLSYWDQVKSVKTIDVTKSFGWNGNEAFAQHDVQELMRILFDALEHKLQNTEQKDILKDLYQGKMVDYVKCKFCGYESRREDAFQDINLAIKPFGAISAFGSLQEALKDFVKAETLDGSNQYNCSACDEKRDAEKGLKITKLPYLLTIQLKRFDFDYETFDRVKLSDRVEFPFQADFSEFVPETEEGQDYELFSVMIHSGSATGGHYYAYIKSYEDKLWYEFNDDTVKEITIDEVKRMFGEQNLRFPNSAHSTNAYMLVYRRIDEAKNVGFQDLENLPQHIQELVNAEKLDFEKNGEEKSKSFSHTKNWGGLGTYNNPAPMSELPMSGVTEGSSSNICQNYTLKLWGAESRTNAEKIATTLADTDWESYQDHTMVFDHELTYKEFLELVKDKANQGDQNQTLATIDLKRMRLIEFEEHKKLPGKCIGESTLRRHLYGERSSGTSVDEVKEQLAAHTGDSLRDFVLDTKMIELLPSLKYSNCVNVLLQVRGEDESFPRNDCNQHNFKCYRVNNEDGSIGAMIPLRLYKKHGLPKLQEEIVEKFGIPAEKLLVRAFYERGMTDKILQVIPPPLDNWEHEEFRDMIFDHNNMVEIMFYIDHVDEVIARDETMESDSGSSSPINFNYGYNQHEEIFALYESKMLDTLNDAIQFHRNLRKFPVEIHEDCRMKVDGVDEPPVVIDNAKSLAAMRQARTRSKSERNYDLPGENERQRHFKVTRQENVGVWIDAEGQHGVLNKENRLKLWVEMDKRMSPKQFKLQLEQYTCMSCKDFRLFERFGVGKTTDGFEIKMDRKNVFDLVTQSTFIIKPGRAAREGELTLKLFELDLGNAQTSTTAKEKFEIIMQKNDDNVEKLKRKVLEILKLDESYLARLNIRGKNNKKVLYNDQLLKEMTNISYAKDFYYDITDDKYPPAAKTTSDQRSVFLLRWRPSEMKFDDHLVPVTLNSELEEDTYIVDRIDDIEIKETNNNACNSPADSTGMRTPGGSANCSDNDDPNLNNMEPIGGNNIQATVGSVNDWQQKINNSPPPYNENLIGKFNAGDSNQTSSPKSTPKHQHKQSSYSWKRNRYTIAQLRDITQKIYGIKNASFAKCTGSDFPPVINGAVVEENFSWIKEIYDTYGPGYTPGYQPVEISDQPFCVWDDSAVILVKDLDEPAKQLSPTELADFKKQEAIRIGKAKRAAQAKRNSNYNFVREEKKLEIKDDRWEERNKKLEILKQQEKDKQEPDTIKQDDVD